MTDISYLITGGFFDAVDSDRLYSADQMNQPYKKLIHDGINREADGTTPGFAVTAGGGMNVLVATGNAMIGGKWAENKAVQTIAVAGNTSGSARIDSIILQCDKSRAVRAVQIVYRQGTAAAPDLVSDDDITELRLANIRVPSAASAIASENITDTRGGAECPWVRSVFDAPDARYIVEEYTGTELAGAHQTVKSAVDSIRYAAQSGQPTVALQASDMIDSNKVYLYQGNETGYSAGYLYYYSDAAGAWIRGAQYGASIVDTALDADSENPVQNKAVTAAITGLNGRLEALEESGTGGLTVEQITALSAIVKKIAFNGNADNEVDAFNEAFGLISVTGVSLNTTSGSLEVGETLQLVATVLPANALDKSVTWVSSDTSVATVSENGLITAVGIGTFTVTVRTNDGAYTATFNGSTSAATVKYPVSYNLSNVTSSNNISQVTQGDSYTTTISVNTGYMLGSISVTMGGTDVTAEVVSGKNISISTITGAIVITATATEDTRTLLYSWDLTNSLVDTVQGATATLPESGASRDSGGVHITSATGYCAFPNDIAANAEITIEVDVASADFKFSSGHGRLITFGNTSSPTGSGDGVIYRSTGYWAIYLSSWTDASSFTGKNDFSGKTLKLTKTSNNTFTLYCDGVQVTSKQQNTASAKRLVLGTSAGNAFYNAVFSAVRIYEGVA